MAEPRRISDRGPAKYFHGRGAILEEVDALLDDARSHRDGTIFLIQGAPGAGKTALLAECVKRASEKGWKTASISTRALHDPSSLAKHLAVPYETQVTRTRTTQASARVPGVGAYRGAFRKGDRRDLAC